MPGRVDWWCGGELKSFVVDVGVGLFDADVCVDLAESVRPDVLWSLAWYIQRCDNVVVAVSCSCLVDWEKLASVDLVSLLWGRRSVVKSSNILKVWDDDDVATKSLCWWDDGQAALLAARVFCSCMRTVVGLDRPHDCRCGVAGVGEWLESALEHSFNTSRAYRILL